jgi:hypothetical protein
LVIFLVVAASTTLVPGWAMGENQGVAETIAANLREGGQLTGYKIGVKYQDGTAWLRGTVRDQSQMNTAMNLALQTSGVKRVVNDLTLTEVAPPTQNPIGELADHQARPAGSAIPVASSFRPMPVTPASVTEMAPTLAPMPSAKGAPMLAPVPSAPARPVPHMASRPRANYSQGTPLPIGQQSGGPMPQYVAPTGNGVTPVRYDQPHVPNYAWPSYAAHPNYAALTYPKQHSPTAYPYIGPFYPYPQVPLGWRKVTLEWHDGWWQLDFDDGAKKGLFSGLFRHGH